MNEDIKQRAEEIIKKLEFGEFDIPAAEVVMHEAAAFIAAILTALSEMEQSDASIRTLCGESPESPAEASTVELVRNLVETLVNAGERVKELETRLAGRTYFHSDAEVERQLRQLAEGMLKAHKIKQRYPLDKPCDCPDCILSRQILGG